MRLFVAILLSSNMKTALQSAQMALQRQGAVGRYVPPENLHLTLAFLGETKRIAAAATAIGVARLCAPFPLVLEGGGHFGDLWWSGIQSHPGLDQMARRVSVALQEAGFSLEDRSFLPHITVARRLKGGESLTLLMPPARMQVTKISLMSSELCQGKRIYREIAFQKMRQKG